MGSTTDTSPATRLTIDVWADVLCPWCYLGEHRLAAAIDRSPHAERIQVRIHTFQLDPTASTRVMPILDYLSAKYVVPTAQARAMEQEMAGKAAAEGLVYEVDRPARNTLDMLRLVHLGAEYGLGWQYLRAMQAEIFGGNFEAFEPDTLLRIGQGLGIRAAEIRDVLATDRYTDAVRTDHDSVTAMGARGVPFTVLDHRSAIPGAVGVEEYADAINMAWERIDG